MNKLKLIICATFGNCFEVYDFIIYQLMASHISNNFFDKNCEHSFIATQLVFILTTIISRPLGGIIFGYISDLKGRKLSLEKSILMSGLCTGMIGLIPSYKDIGFVATLFLILLRFLQGISLGGEQGTSISFLIEHSSPKSRGFLSSFCCVGQQAGILLAILAASIYNWHIKKSGTEEVWWRILFIFSFFIGLFGYWVRKKTNETIDFLLDRHCSDKTISLLEESKLFIFKNKQLFLSVFFIVSFGTFMTYTVFVVGNSHLKQLADSLQIFAYIQYLMSLLVIFSIPVFGYFSDIIGRKTIISHSLAAISALSIPFFQSLQSVANYNTLVVAVLLAISCGAFFSVTPTIVAESLPTRSRCINYAVFYAVPAAIMSAISPFVSAFLISINPTYIAYVIILLAMVAIFCLKSFNEPIELYSKLNKYSYEFLKP